LVKLIDRRLLDPTAIGRDDLDMCFAHGSALPELEESGRRDQTEFIQAAGAALTGIAHDVCS
jgi:hypothetical protein